MDQIKDGCTCMPGKQKDTISHSISLEIDNKEKLAEIVEREGLKKMIKDEITELKKIKKEIDELDYC